MPFFAVHLICFAALWTGVSAFDLGLCLLTYTVRMFGITGAYHRYFSHRTYKTTRWFQFVLAWIGCSALQKGPLWWSAHHRDHHRYSDTDLDPHSPITRSVWWAHLGWVLDPDSDETDMTKVKDLARFPELCWLNNWHWIPGIALGFLCYGAGVLFGAGGGSALIWGLFISTVLCYHGTFLVNSLCHLAGKRRYATSDRSRNNWFVALVTLGEGWHNNHHHYQASANQGFYWWEIDGSYYILKTLSFFGLVWDLRLPPAKHLAGPREQQPEAVAVQV